MTGGFPYSYVDCRVWAAGTLYVFIINGTCHTQNGRPRRFTLALPGQNLAEINKRLLSYHLTKIARLATKHCCVQGATGHCRHSLRACSWYNPDGWRAAGQYVKRQGPWSTLQLGCFYFLVILSKPQKHKILRFPNMDLEQAGSIKCWQYCLSTNSFPPHRTLFKAISPSKSQSCVKPKL